MAAKIKLLLLFQRSQIGWAGQLPADLFVKFQNLKEKAIKRYRSASVPTRGGRLH